MKKSPFFIAFLFFATSALFAQVSINSDGSAPNPSAMLDVKSNNSGFLFPRLSDAARNSIPSPGTGLLIYNTSSNRLNYFNGSQWCQVEISISSSTTGSLLPGGGVSINESNTPPEGSAMLDINSSSRGVLIPRTTPGSVSAPARGLIIYNNATNRINYYDGSVWLELCSMTTGVSGSAGSQNSIGVAINTSGASTDQSAILEVSASDKGVLIPRLTEMQRNAILPLTGLTIYNLNSDEIQFYNGTDWCKLIVSILSAPTEGIHVPSATQIVWNWNAVSGASGYKWSVANDFATATDMGSDTTKTETGLTCNTAYTRYVWTYSACGNSTFVTLTQLTPACPFSCGSSITINHMAGAIAPVSKTATYGTVTNITGEPSKCWITSNLGSDHQATAVNDATEASAGWYWQFNRMQGYKYEGTMRTPNTTWITSITENFDWQTANDPCTLELGTGWRIPTTTEWTNVDASGGWTNWNGPWNSDLKMHAAGQLSYSNGLLYFRGSYSYYWSSNQSSASHGWYLIFYSGASYTSTTYKAYGFSLRCIRDCSTAPNAPTAGTHVPSPTQVVWNWNTVSGATGYKWSLSNDIATATDMDTATTKTETGLTCNTAYTRYVWAYNSCGNSNALPLNQTTSACPFSCGSPINITHIEGEVAPVTKTVSYGTVTNIPGEPSKCWITSNLGADHQATALDDATEASAGWYWQFNRKQGYKHDGTTRTPNTPWPSTYDYLDWQSVNDPCTIELGAGWRIPTKTEWENVDYGGAWVYGDDVWNSALKLHAAGMLDANTGSLALRGIDGRYWSSTQYPAYYGYALMFHQGTCLVAWWNVTLSGESLRCLKDN